MEAEQGKPPQRGAPAVAPYSDDADAVADALSRLGPMTDGMAMDALGWGGTRVWQAMQSLVDRGGAA